MASARIPQAKIDAAKLFFFQGQGLVEIAKKLEVNYNALYKRAERNNWIMERNAIQNGKSVTKLDIARPEILVARNLAEDAQHYKEAVSKQIIEKGLNPLSCHNVTEIGEVHKHFVAMNSIHSVAKDIFGIGKEQPTQNLLINMSFLSADDENMPVINIKQADSESNDSKAD